ncbi:proteasome activator complex subunit 4A-like, partial [Pseudomyrmex gracilis]|uniref:proteasome activator complex subunit 4A-like n=1 Tax=Pseudomyrmex gracilis TaxID=219809 RepID=UPI000995C133
MSFTTNLGYYPQKELRYTKLLPFKDQLEKESLEWLVRIKENLGRSVMLREIEPACVFWTKQLYMYIEVYGLMFSKEDHIIFAKLMYEIITIPKVNASVMLKCTKVLKALLKKEELISPDELEIPWRPFYKLLCKFTDPGMYYYNLNLRQFLDDIRYIVTYFSLTATQEILDELRPTFCPFNAAMRKSIYVLSILLPTKLRPQHHSVGYLLWFDELMNMWKVFHNSPSWDISILYLMGRLARDNIGYIDWNPHLPVMFSRFIRYLNLPVMYKNVSDNRKSTFRIAPISWWIVGALGNGSDAQKYLNKFLKTIETYIYPANYKRWTKKLTKFLSILTDEFLIRLRKERYNNPTWETSIPDNYKLTNDDIDAFVKSVLPLAMVVMYHEQTFTTEYTTLQNLAVIRPNLVIPYVLEETYSTFTSLIKPHKLIPSIKCMTFLAQQMVQGSRYMNGDHAFPEGPTHVIPLLFQSLPGIDANDLKKCYVTLTFIGVYCELISLVDCSQCTTDNTIEETVCKDTSRFEDF